MRHIIHKITNIALIFTLIGVFLCSNATFTLANSSNLRPALQFGSLKNKPSVNLRKDAKVKDDKQDPPEFRYYIRDEDGKLLKEPCGSPGYWTVELNIPRKHSVTAAVERAVKSFSLSARLTERGDIETAKFTIVNTLSVENADILIKEKDFYIKKSDIFGLEVVLASSFLGRGISEQREIFASAFRRIPQDIDLKPQDYATVKRMTMGKTKRVMVFNSPLMQKGGTRRFSSLNSSSLALASLLKDAGYKVAIDRHSFREAFVDLPGFGNKLNKHLKRLYAKMIAKLILRDVDVVCLSVYGEDLPFIKLFTELLRKAKPGIIIVVGGHGVTVTPEHIAAHLPEVNIFYRGEAEAGFVRTLDSLNRLDLDDIDSQSMARCFREDRGTMIRLGNIYQFNDFIHVNRMTEKQFNDRELDFSILTPRDIDGMFSLMTGLGCPFNCVFCATAGGLTHRVLNPRAVIATVLGYQYRLKELGMNYDVPVSLGPTRIWRIGLSDDNYLRDPKRAIEILELWKDPEIKVKCIGFQSTLQSFLIKDKSGRWTVNTALMDAIADFKDPLSYDFSIEIGTDDLLDEEIKRLGKAPYTEQLIEQVIEEFEKRGIFNTHFLILVNPETSLENLVEKLLKAVVLKARHIYVDFFVNTGIVLDKSTGLANKIIEEKKEFLIHGEVISIDGFEEYDSYWAATKLFSENMPEDINRHIQKYRRKENNAGLKFLLDFLDYVLEKIDKNLDSIGEEEARYYKGLLNERVKQKIREFVEVSEEKLAQGKPDFGPTLRHLSSIERKLLFINNPGLVLQKKKRTYPLWPRISVEEDSDSLKAILNIDPENRKNNVTFLHRLDLIKKNLLKLVYLTDKSGKNPIGYILYEPKDGNLAHFRRIFTKDGFRQRGVFKSLLKFCMDNFDGIILNLYPDEFNSDLGGEKKLENLRNMCFGLGFKTMLPSEFYWVKEGSGNEDKIHQAVNDLDSTMRRQNKLAEIPAGERHIEANSRALEQPSTHRQETPIETADRLNAEANEENRRKQDFLYHIDIANIMRDILSQSGNI